MTHLDSATLIARCLDGQDDARAEFLVTYLPLVRASVRRTLAGVESIPGGFDSEDVCSEVFVRLLENDCHALRGLKNPSCIDSWLMTVARNRTITFLRRNGGLAQKHLNGTREEPAVYATAPDAEAMAQERKDIVREAVGELAPKDRLVLQLFYLYDLRYAEIGETLGMNINTVASRIARAKSKLRERLQEKLS